MRALRRYDLSMTKRVTVSLPDDVAAYLEQSDNASATVTEALRIQMDKASATEEMLVAMGFKITPEGRARARKALSRLDDRKRAEIADRYKRLRAGMWTEGSAE
jgi:hypothetical protein